MKLVCGVGINDADYVVKPLIAGNDKVTNSMFNDIRPTVSPDDSNVLDVSLPTV